MEVMRLLVQSRTSTVLHATLRGVVATHTALLESLCQEAERTAPLDSRARLLDFVLCCALYRSYSEWFLAPKKTTLIQVGSMFEGAPNFYKTGTRQSDATARRVTLLNALFGFTTLPRNPRTFRPPPPTAETPPAKKPKHSAPPRPFASECVTCRSIHCQPPLVFCGHWVPIQLLVENPSAT
jgi:hypothetical protein